ncbi:hypothetical protein CEXT_31681 [Caerostris extrusa]|uniref:Uncharacterized protein n=1 Tax=Caerostris extrusa TaxID=172846 RepID=A0AAV4YGL1_CAEEX|nr:hypothetical protein CEXT_31681 [Caerostris extrusa]
MKERRNRNPMEGFSNRSGNNDTPSNAHLGSKNERLMRRRNIRRVLGPVPRTGANRCPSEFEKKGKQKGKEGSPNRSGNNDTPSNVHLGRKNERLMRRRNIKRVWEQCLGRAPTEPVNRHLELLAMIRSSRKFVNCLPSRTATERGIVPGERFARNLR